MKTMLALGDCNTLGVGKLHQNGYPRRAAARLGMHLRNCAWTMATTREGINLLQDHMSPEVEIVLIQFGLVDSYLTFRFAPYVLYYPDNPLRKQYRSLVKSYKKFCRRRGLHRLFGSCEVVEPEEYERNLETMIATAGSARVLLLETIPHHQQRRNHNIRRYNEILATIARRHRRVDRIALYDRFTSDMERLYLDETHCNAAGHELIARCVVEALQ